MSKPVYANKPRTRIKPISHARAGRLKEYARLKRAFWKDPKHKNCCFEGCQREATEIHHKFGRVGKLLNATEHWKGLCRWHHDWVHRDPDGARSLGLLALKGQWLNPPKK
jgi:hypothetical protein